MSEPLFRGIVYERQSANDLRPIIIHRMTIDLREQGIRPFVTPGRQGLEVKARTTSEFQLQVAVNGSIFSPCYTKHPLDFYPHSGDPVDIAGQMISDGVEYSPAQSGWDVLCFGPDNHASLAPMSCPHGTRWGIATTNRLIRNGELVPLIGSDEKASSPHPRAAIGLDDTGYRLFIVSIDGRQPFYSEGVSLPELAAIVKGLGAFEAVALDGGGSVTLVTEQQRSPKVLNSPIHTYIPLRERPVGTHLGFFAEPLGGQF